MDRGTILENAHTHTKGDRDKEYGSPYTNLTDCAHMWNAYLNGKYHGVMLFAGGLTITAEDVAHLNQLQKIARTFSGVVKMDTYEDNAAYAAIAGECAAMASGKDNVIEDTPESEEVPAFIRDRKSR